MDTIYVYYKVNAANAQAVLRAAQALTTGVAEATGARARLLRRREQPGTWMEVYDTIGDAATLERVLDERVAACGFLDLLEGSGRHTERFTPLAAADLALLDASL